MKIIEGKWEEIHVSKVEAELTLKKIVDPGFQYYQGSRWNDVYRFSPSTEKWERLS